MDATAWLAGNAEARIQQDSFACLEGCGFCCTYPPAVTEDELARIEGASGLPPTQAGPTGDTRLALQGGCGGCTLLEDRRCTAYDERPMHCRLFPFHVYLGREVEIYADRVCPGLDPSPAEAGDAARQADPREIAEALEAAGEAARLEELEAKRDNALRVHERFEQIAREEGVWRDPDATIAEARDQARPTPRAWQAALDTYRNEDPVAYPTMVLPGEDFEWRAWQLDGDAFTRYRFTEAGEMEPVGQAPLPDRGRAPEACRTVFERLSSYECFAGGVFDRVDHAGYETPLDEAARREADEVLAELVVSAHLVEAEDLPATPRWVAAAYEPVFFDRPAIGAWL